MTQFEFFEFFRSFMKNHNDNECNVTIDSSLCVCFYAKYFPPSYSHYILSKFKDCAYTVAPLCIGGVNYVAIYFPSLGIVENA